MSSTPAKSPAKKRASSGKAKKTASHPTYAAMTKSAINHLKEKGGSSKAAILKYILSNYKVGDNIKSAYVGFRLFEINAHLRMAINRGVKSGALKQVKGHGASGSFRLGDKAVKPKKAATKKPKAVKKKASPKKAAKPKKAKTSPKKKSSPKKKAAPKKAKTPKKAPAKKSPKKKAAKKTSPKKK